MENRTWQQDAPLISELYNEIAALRRDVEALKLKFELNPGSPRCPQKPKRLEMWKPEKGVTYAYIDATGKYWKAPWHIYLGGQDADDGAFRFGNVFNSNELADAHSKRLGVFNRLWRLAEQCELVESGLCWVIASDSSNEVCRSSQAGKMWPAFKTKEDAQLVLDSLSEEDRKYLRGEA